MITLPQEIIDELLRINSADLPDDPVIRKRLETLASKRRKEIAVQFVLPHMVMFVDFNGWGDNEMCRFMSPVFEDLGYPRSYAKNFWNRTKREYPEFIEDVRQSDTYLEIQEKNAQGAASE